MPIKASPKYLMTIGESTTVGRRLVTKVRSSGLSDPHLLELTDHLESALNPLEENLNAGSDPSLSAEVQEIDRSRDETLTRFAGYIRGQQNSLDPAKADAADTVYGILERHDFGARAKAYAEESAVINALLLDLQESKCRQAMRFVMRYRFSRS